MYQPPQAQTPRETDPTEMDTMIDLRLAESYTPILFCMFKTLISIFVFVVLDTTGFERYTIFLIIYLAVYLDRLLGIEYIFNGNNAVWICVTGLLLNCLRSTLTSDSYNGRSYGMIAGSANLIWWAISCLIYTQKTLQCANYFKIRGTCAVLTCVMILTHAHIHMDEESHFMLFLRPQAFLIISFIWIYALNPSILRRGSNEIFSECMHRFSVLLFVSAYLFYMLTLGYLIFFLYLCEKGKEKKGHSLLPTSEEAANQDSMNNSLYSNHETIRTQTNTKSKISLASQDTTYERETTPLSTIAEEQHQDLMETFRRAKEQAAKGSLAD